eukprot:1070382-Pelagomonas_calceolata.AAC.2
MQGWPSPCGCFVHGVFPTPIPFSMCKDLANPYGYPAGLVQGAPFTVLPTTVVSKHEHTFAPERNFAYMCSIGLVQNGGMLHVRVMPALPSDRLERLDDDCQGPWICVKPPLDPGAYVWWTGFRAAAVFGWHAHLLAGVAPRVDAFWGVLDALRSVRDAISAFQGLQWVSFAPLQHLHDLGMPSAYTGLMCDAAPFAAKKNTRAPSTNQQTCSSRDPPLREALLGVPQLLVYASALLWCALTVRAAPQLLIPRKLLLMHAFTLFQA